MFDISGFQGQNCSENIDDCAQGLCDPNHTLRCVDGIASYTCVCHPGFMGVFCEIDIDECLEHRCIENATCVDMANGYRYDL